MAATKEINLIADYADYTDFYIRNCSVENVIPSERASRGICF